VKLSKKIFIIALLPITLIADVPWHTVSFGISNHANSATFHMNNFFIGVDAERMSFDGNLWTNEWTYFEPYYYIDSNTGEEVYVGPTSEWILKDVGISVGAWLITPKLGKRFQLKKSDKIQSFLDIEGYLTIPFLELSLKAEDDEEPEDLIDNKDVTDAKDIVDNLLDFSGFKFSYGITYNVNKQLSFSTSFGYNHYFSNFDYTSKSEDQEQIASLSLDANEGYTFTAFTINFTF
tara:strand:- start:1718 stop:2422 length:705 start_codon:yes stop_codon:yes gene_type:complete